MKGRRLFLVLFLLPALALAEGIYRPDAEPEAARRELDAFFRKLGFEDYSGAIERAIESPAPDADLSNLRIARQRYLIFNHVRELAVEILAETGRRPKDPETRKKIVAFTGRLMAMQPWDGPRDIPKERLEGVPPEKFEETALKYLAEETARNMERHAQTLAADALETLFGVEAVERLRAEKEANGKLGPESQRLADRMGRVGYLAGQIVRHTYLDSEMGQSREAGRAFALGLARQAKVTGDEGLLKELRAEARRQGTDLRNFVGTTLVFHGDDGKEHTITGRTGDFWNERTRETEAGSIVGGVSPHPENRREARRKKLTGLLSAAFVMPEYPLPDPLTRLREYLGTRPFLTTGFSHVGMGRAYEADGISTYRIIDVYPSGIPVDPAKPDGEVFGGGIRIIDAHQFALEGPMMRVSRTRYDPASFRAWARQQLREKGYRPVSWVGKQFPENAEGEPDRTKPSKPVVWNTTIPEAEFWALHNLPLEMPATVRRWLRDLAARGQTPPAVTAFADGLAREGGYVVVPREVRQWLEGVSGATGYPEKWLQALRTDQVKEDPKAVKEWFAELGRRMTDHMVNEYLVRKGVGFASGFTDDNRLYCTKNCVMAGWQATGLDLQRHPDRWSWKVALLRTLGVPAATELEPGAIFSPATFAWQKDLTHGREGRTDTITYPPMDRVAQYEAITRAPEEPMNPRMLEVVREVGGRVFASPAAHIAEDLTHSIGLLILSDVRKGNALSGQKFRSGGAGLNGYLATCSRQLKALR